MDALPISTQQIQAALSLQDFDPMPAMMAMAPRPRPLQRPVDRPDTARKAAVLILLFPSNDGLSFVLIRRNQYPGVHSGQIALPGGRREEGEEFVETALRETYEELGVPAESIELLGTLTDIYIPPSDFEVHPYVGYSGEHPHWKPDTGEVAEVIETPLAVLFDPMLKLVDDVEVRGVAIKAPYYAIQGHKVWGATAIILSELEGRLRAVLPGA